MKFDIKGNLKKGFTTDALIQDLAAVGAAVVYRTLPSFFGLNGWGAWALGVGVPFITGKLLNIPGMAHGAIACGTAHALQFLEPQFKDLTGKSFWVIDPSETTPVSDGGLGANVLRPGQNLFAYDPQEVRRLAQSPSLPMNDGGMGEVIDTTRGHSVVTPSGQIMSQKSPFVQQQAGSPFAASSLY